MAAIAPALPTDPSAPGPAEARRDSQEPRDPRDEEAGGAVKVSPVKTWLRVSARGSPFRLRRQGTLVPGIVGYSSSKTKILRELLCAEGRQTAQGLGLVLMALPVALLIVLTYNYAADDVHAEGVLDVRYPAVSGNDSTGTPDKKIIVTAITWVVQSELMALAMVTNARLVLHNLRGAGKRLKRVEVALYLVTAWFIGTGTLYDWNEGLQRLGLFIAVTGCLGLHAHMVGSSVGKRRLTLLLVCTAVVMLALACAQSWYIGPYVVANETSDLERLLYVALVQPVVVELALIPMRVCSRYFPGEHMERTMAASFWVIVQSNMMSRWVVTVMHTNWATVGSVAAVTVADLIRRGTVQTREFVVLWILLRDKAQARAIAWSPESHACKANISVMEELGEVVGVGTAAMLTILFRVSHERAAPSAGAVLLSAGLQILVGQSRDLFFNGAAALVTPTETPREAPLTGADRWKRWLLRVVEVVRRHSVHQLNVHHNWTRAFWLVLSVMSVSSTMFFCLIAFEPEAGADSMYCPWSKHNGWWHYMPCARSGKLLGVL